MIRGRGTRFSRHQLLLYRGDLDRLNEIHPERSATSVIRELVSRHVAHALERQAEKERPAATQKPRREAQG